MFHWSLQFHSHMSSKSILTVYDHSKVVGSGGAAASHDKQGLCKFSLCPSHLAQRIPLSSPMPGQKQMQPAQAICSCSERDNPILWKFFSLKSFLVTTASEAPCHDLGSFCLLGCPTLTPARSQLEEQASLNLPTAAPKPAPANTAFLWPHACHQRSHVQEEICLWQWFSKCGPGCSIPIIWEPVRKASCQTSAQTYWIRNTGIDAQHSVFNKPARWFRYMPRFDNLHFEQFSQIMLILLIWVPGSGDHLLVHLWEWLFYN